MNKYSGIFQMGKLIYKVRKFKNRFVPQHLYLVWKSYLRLNITKLSRDLSLIEDDHYLAVYHPDWLGVGVATRELFDNTLSISEVFSRRKARRIASILLQKPFKLYIFSGFAYGWEYIVKALKEADASVVVKVIWHGGHSLNVEEYDWNRFQKVFDLHNKGFVDTICFVKKSMAELYGTKGYRTAHIMNNVYSVRSDSTPIKLKNHNMLPIRIGLYVSGDRWVKNIFNQLAAISLIKDAMVDCVPLSNKTFGFAEILDIPIEGAWQSLSREELFHRMSKNDVNLYATFSECAPLIPLESFELGVPCITGNNHHFWDDSGLKQFIVVDEVDSPYAIYQKIMECLNNKEHVMKLYREWKQTYDLEAAQSLRDFLTIQPYKP
jgi:glycosyltransferase involved in cell wall biosynthesis